MTARPGLTAGRRPSLPPLIGRARRLLAKALAELPASQGVLVACSGGPDSLALAAVAAFFTRSRAGRRPVGAAVVDHGLQDGSADVAQRTADVLRGLELDPVVTCRISVLGRDGGPEAAARAARYRALTEAAQQAGAGAVLLGHTRDDQAEQVLLGLARGSGTRSLAGMPARRPFPGGVFLRPFLSLSREETERICALAGITPWHDPSNADLALTRCRVRHQVLPELERQLGPGVSAALARSAQILAEDAQWLDAQASAEYQRLAQVVSPGELTFPLVELRELPAALRRRVIALAVAGLGAGQPSFERLLAVETLLSGGGSAGPVQLAGKVEGYRRRSAGYARLVLQRHSVQ